MTNKKYFTDFQLSTAVKRAEGRRGRHERRIKYWRAGMIALFVSAALLFLLLDLGAFDGLIRGR